MASLDKKAAAKTKQIQAVTNNGRMDDIVTKLPGLKLPRENR